MAAETRIGHMNPALQFLAAFTLGYTYATFAEAFIHQYISDASAASVRRWKRSRFNLLLRPMIRTNFSHHAIHHCSTYKRDHVTQFSSTEEKALLDRELAKFSHGREVMGMGEYGNKFSAWGWVASCAPFVPGVYVAYIALGWAGAFGSFLTLGFPPLMNNYLHRYTHLPFDRAVKEAPVLLSWFIRTPYMRAVTRHHFLHHRYEDSNYNMVLGSDWIRGKWRRPNQQDLDDMRHLGIRID